MIMETDDPHYLKNAVERLKYHMPDTVIEKIKIDAIYINPEWQANDKII